MAVLILLAGLASLQGCGAPAGDTASAAPPETLALTASVTLTPDQVAQPENIFVYSFPLPPGPQNFLGLSGTLSMTQQQQVFNESLMTVATNTAGACPADGSVFPDYTALYNAYPNLQPVQSFILKNPLAGTSAVDVNYTMPAGLPISGCIVLFLDWEGDSAVTMSSELSLSYAAATTSSPQATLLQTNEEFVFGDNEGAGSTTDDALSFVQETLVPQAGTILAFVGDISDSSFFVPPPPGAWTASNDIYLVPGGCPKNIPVNASGGTNKAGKYYADIPADAQHLLSVPLGGTGTAVAQQFVYQGANVPVAAGDCLLTLFGLDAPKGGIDSENQVKTLFLPAP